MLNILRLSENFFPKATSPAHAPAPHQMRFCSHRHLSPRSFAGFIPVTFGVGSFPPISLRSLGRNQQATGITISPLATANTALCAPMPGVVASVGAVVGQQVHAADLLLTIEAMKMETGIHAERDAIVKAVHVTAGGQIDAKDLLVELE